MASSGVTDIQRASLARAAGFPDNEIARAVAVSLAENTAGDPGAEHVNTNGSIDYGLWQINSIHNLSVSQLKDPQGNANAAFQIWKAAGNSWSPWSTFKSGKYLAFFQRGQAAAHNKQAPDPNAGPTISVADNSSLQGIVDFFKFISDPHNWQRIGIFILGGILMIVGLFKITSLGAVAKKTAKTAAMVAAVVPK